MDGNDIAVGCHGYEKNGRKMIEGWLNRLFPSSRPMAYVIKRDSIGFLANGEEYTNIFVGNSSTLLSSGLRTGFFLTLSAGEEPSGKCNLSYMLFQGLDGQIDHIVRSVFSTNEAGRWAFENENSYSDPDMGRLASFERARTEIEEIVLGVHLMPVESVAQSHPMLDRYLRSADSPDHGR